MDALLVAIVAAGLGLVAYSYVFYPLLLPVVAAATQVLRDIRFVSGKRERRREASTDLPVVAVVISAYNEERHIAARVRNLLELDYPLDRLRILVGSDGGSDRTGEILSALRHDSLEAHVFGQNRGKANVLNDLVARTDAPILAFSDANTFFDRDALRRLVAHFDDPRVGGVSGELRLNRSGGDNQDSAYWRVEQFLKFFEARIGGLLGANGAIYAIRRELWRPLAPDTICDDFCVAMNVSAAGRRLVYEPAAFAEEDTPDSIGEEFRRRVRIGIGNFQALFRHPEYLLRTSWGTRFAYVSHKVLRWIAPHLLLAALAASIVLGLQSRAWLAFALLQVAGYALSAALFAASNRGLRLPGPLRIPAFLFALNLAFLVASWRYATGRYSGSWRRSSR